MDKNEIFEVIKKNIVEVVPELASKTIQPTDSLQALGANSVDRAEIIVLTLAALKIKIPLATFGGAKNIEDMINVVLANSNQSS